MSDSVNRMGQTDVTWERLVEGHSPKIREVFAACRALVLETMPGANEQVDLPDRVLAFGYGPPGGVRMRDLLVALIPHIAHVNVQLADGADLADPAGIIEGTGKRIRHVKCRSLEDVSRAALRSILEEQVARRRE